LAFREDVAHLSEAFQQRFLVWLLLFIQDPYFGFDVEQGICERNRSHNNGRVAILLKHIVDLTHFQQEFTHVKVLD
jgi:hypothetical protein